MKIGSTKSAKLAACTIAGASLMIAPVAQAENSYQDTVNRLLDATESLARSQGFSSSHNRFGNSLRENQTDSVSLTLQAGTSYMLIGQCDTDCSDIDMWLYDENGNEIDSDVQTDDTPIVLVTPRRTARFSYTIKMYNCRVEPCYYGVAVYAK